MWKWDIIKDCWQNICVRKEERTDLCLSINSMWTLLSIKLHCVAQIDWKVTEKYEYN